MLISAKCRLLNICMTALLLEAHSQRACLRYGLSFTTLPYHISNTYTLVNVDIVQHRKTLLYIPHTLLLNTVHGTPFQLYFTVNYVLLMISQVVKSCAIEWLQYQHIVPYIVEGLITFASVNIIIIITFTSSLVVILSFRY